MFDLNFQLGSKLILKLAGISLSIKNNTIDLNFGLNSSSVHGYPNFLVDFVTPTEHSIVNMIHK